MNGFRYSDIAHLLNVNIRTIKRWAKDFNIKSHNKKRTIDDTLLELQQTLEFGILCYLLRIEKSGFSWMPNCKKIVLELLTKLSIKYTISANRVYIVDAPNLLIHNTIKQLEPYYIPKSVKQKGRNHLRNLGDNSKPFQKGKVNYRPQKKVETVNKLDDFFSIM
jgi:hypothetical protein